MTFPPLRGKPAPLASVDGAASHQPADASVATVPPSASPAALRYRVVDTKALSARPVTQVPAAREMTTPSPARPMRPIAELAPEMRRLIKNLAHALGRDKDLTARLIGALRGSTLDLGSLNVQTIERLRPSVWAALVDIAKGSIDTVMLPKGLGAWPVGLEHFQGLGIVVMPAFEGVLPARLGDTVVLMPQGNMDGRLTARRVPLFERDSGPAPDTEVSRARAHAVVLFLDSLSRDSTTLDLTRMALATLANLPAGAWEMLKSCQPISTVALPAGLFDLPNGIERLAGLETLTLPNFRGESIELPYALRQVRIATPDRAERGKVVVRRPDGKGSFEGEPSEDHVYFRQPPAGHDPDQTITLNLNFKASFQSGEPIVCRHLVMAQTLSRIEYLEAREGASAKGAQARFSYTDFSSAQQISGRVTPHDDKLWSDIVFRPYSENLLLPLASLSLALRDRFGEMQRGGKPVQHFLVLSFKHAMSLELRIKTSSSGTPRYVLTFYDPNRTMTHRRLVVTDLNRLQVGIEDLVGREATLENFGPVAEGYVRLIGITKANLVGGSDLRVQPTRFYPPLRTEMGAHELYMLVRMNAVDQLSKRLAALPTDRQARRTTLAGNVGGYDLSKVPLIALFAAPSRAMIRRYTCAVLDDPILTPDDKFALLNASIEGESVQAKWLQASDSTWVAGFLNAIVASDLTQEQKIELLMARVRGQPVINRLAVDRQGVYQEVLGRASAAQLSERSRQFLGDAIGLVIPPVAPPGDPSPHAEALK